MDHAFQLVRLTHIGVATAIKHGCTDVADSALFYAIAGHTITMGQGMNSSCQYTIYGWWILINRTR